MCRSAVALLVGALALGTILPAQAATSDVYPMPLVVRAEGLQLSHGIVAMARETEVLLPVRALALALEFPVDLDVDRARADGWFLEPERGYLIDAREQRVRSEGVSHDFQPNEFLTSELDSRQEIYVTPDVLEAAWPIRISVSRADLAVDIEALEPLPIQQRRRREERRDRLRNRENRDDPDLPSSRNAYSWLTSPIVGIDVQARSGGGSHAVRENLTWSQEIAGVTVDAGVAASGPTFSDSRVDEARMTLQRFAGDDKWPVGLQRIAAGDVSGESFERIGSVGNGRGVTLSSFPLVRSTAYDLFELAGDAPPGWEAELYHNGHLMDYVQVSERGTYQFDGIELAYGVNRLRVMLHGPQGQTRERTEIVDVGQTDARPGETHVRFDRIEAGQDFLDVGDDDGTAMADGAGTSMRAVHGIWRGLSLEAGLMDLPATDRRPESRYSLIGASGALGPTATRVRVLGQHDGGYGVDVDTRMRAGALTLRLGFAEFAEFESPRVGYGSTALVKDTDLTASLPLSLGPARVRLGARYAYSEYVSGSERHRLNLSQRWNTGSVAWYHDVDVHRDSDGDERWSGTLDASDRWFFGARQNLFWSAGLGYAQDDGVTSARFQARYRWSGATTLGLRVRQSRLSDRTSAGLDLTHNWSNARLSLSVEGGEGVAPWAGLRYSVGFGPGGGGGYTLADAQAPRRGALAVHAFIDTDGDGKYDPGEPPVPDARLQTPLNHRASTDDSGRLVLHDLEAHRSFPVRLDPDSLENPFWLPASEGRSVRVRPGSVPLIELPVQETASISGTVALDGTSAEAPGVPLELQNQSGEIVAETRSIFGGFFSFEQVPHGQYQVVAGRGYTLAGRTAEVAPSSANPMPSGLHLTVQARATTESVPADDAPATSSSAAVADPPPSGHTSTVEGTLQVEKGDESPPAPGIRVRLLDRRGQVVQQVRSMSDGTYWFDEVPQGIYSVHIPGAKPAHRRVRVEPEQSVVRLEPFTMSPARTQEIAPRRVSGVVYLVGRSRPASGQPIRLLDQRGQVVRTTETDDAGRYEFSAVDPGTYRIDVAGANVKAVVRGYWDVLELDVSLTNGRAPSR
ncbi:MAG: hypothetical protein WD382_07430 [Halofilum sp. (in: g-proteobacteria)]